jgi:hypothetical protein
VRASATAGLLPKEKESAHGEHNGGECDPFLLIAAHVISDLAGKSP